MSADEIRDELFSPRFYIPLLILLLFVITPLVMREDFFLHIMIFIFLFATLGEAWNILSGYCGQFSLGSTAFFGIGAYTSSVLLIRFGISPWLGMIIGATLAVGVAVIVGIPCFRLGGSFFVLATLAFTMTLMYITLIWKEVTNGPVGISIPLIESPSLIDYQFRTKVPYYYLALTILLIVIYVAYVIKKSRIGYRFVAVREDAEAAESLGINTTKYKLIAFAISAFFTAITGTFYAQYMYYIEPYSLFSLDVMIEVVLLTVFGGIGTVMGPVLGSFVFRPMSDILRFTLGGTFIGSHLIIYGIFMIVAIRYLPHGFIGHLMNLYDSFLKKIRRKSSA